MKKGLTLIELIIVISIIAIVSIIVLPNYRSSNRHLALERSIHTLHHDIRRAQEMAMSATQCPPVCLMGPCVCAGDVPLGFGIVLNQGDEFYRIYADTTESEWFDGGDDIIYRTDLEPTVFIAEIRIDGGVIASGGVNFKSPDPTVNIYRLAPAPLTTQRSELSITLGTNPPGPTRKVIVNRAGSIYVEN